MISLEEALKQGITFTGQNKMPEFVMSSMSYIKASHNTPYSKIIQKIIITNLNLSSYSKKRIKHLIFTFIIYPEAWNGVERYEQKYYTRRDKELYLDIKVSDFNKFCQATKKEAQQIMASEILRGTKKFLQNEKDFDYKKFYADLEKLFKKEGLV